MANLVYSAIMSFDGYIEDADGNFDWAVPDDEVFAFITDLEGAFGTYLYGRRMYEMMACWETDSTLAEQSSLMNDFAEMWQVAEKIVYSTTLETVTTSKTRIERNFDPEVVRAMKVTAASDITVSGIGLAAHAFAAGLVDECHFFLVPVMVGGGKRALPEHVGLGMELQDVRRFSSGMVHLRYDVTS